MEVHPNYSSGQTYEATYTGWLEFFAKLAENPTPLRVSVPRCWKPFVQYMGHEVVSELNWFTEDAIIFPESTKDRQCLRRFAEIAGACRPEIVHAMYLYDMQYGANLPEARKAVFDPKTLAPSTEFVVTCNGSFFRPEVLDYLKLLRTWSAPSSVTNKKWILVPCAADKPYPAPLHAKIKTFLPDAYLIIVTGVLGVVPEDLWPHMPNYDSGLPCFERVYQETKEFFMRNKPKQAVCVYLDHYAHWTAKALSEVSGMSDTKFVFGTAERNDKYLDLLDIKNLSLLLRAAQ